MTVLRYGRIIVDPPLVLAPMAGITDRQFRLVLRRIGGVGLVTMEFISSEALVRKEVKYLYWPDFKHEELFDLKADLAETQNLAPEPGHAKILANLRTRFYRGKAVP